MISVDRIGAQWHVLVRSKHGDGQSSVLRCDKLITATGMNSKPRIPDLKLDDFDGFSFHSLELGKQHERLTSPGKNNHVTIVGGHKTALEAVGIATRAGKKVEWLMRKNGGGPTWMMKARTSKGSSTAKAILIKCLKVFNTSVYQSDNFMDRFLHSGKYAIGTWLCNKFWNLVTDKARSSIPQTNLGSKLVTSSPR